MAACDDVTVSAESRIASLRDAGHAMAARHDRRSGRIVVALHAGAHFTFPARLPEGSAGAAPSQLADTGITPSGLALHWPQLDADVDVRALLAGVFGSPAWMSSPATASPTGEGVGRGGARRVEGVRRGPRRRAGNSADGRP